MIKQNEYHENLSVFKTYPVQLSAYSNTWSRWIQLSEFLENFKYVLKVAILCVGWQESDAGGGVCE